MPSHAWAAWRVSPARPTTPGRLAGPLPAPDPTRDKGSPKARDQDERRRQLVQLLASIEKRVNTENARPRKRYVSPATQEVVYAQYYDALRRRIEDRGTRDFPEYKGKKLYGELTMNIHVDLRGRVIETDIVASSGNRRGSRTASTIVATFVPRTWRLYRSSRSRIGTATISATVSVGGRRSEAFWASSPTP